MTCRFQKVPVVFYKSLVDLENCTSFLKTTCDLLNSTCEIDLLKLLARHRHNTLMHLLIRDIYVLCCKRFATRNPSSLIRTIYIYDEFHCSDIRT